LIHLPGVWAHPGDCTVNVGDMILDAQGDPHAHFVFLVGSTFTVGLPSTPYKIRLINGGSACNVFFSVAGKIDIMPGSVVYGSYISQTTTNVKDGAVVHGRAWGITAAVTMSGDLSAVIDVSQCSDIGVTKVTVKAAAAPALAFPANWVTLVFPHNTHGYCVSAVRGEPSNLAIHTGVATPAHLAIAALGSVSVLFFDANTHNYTDAVNLNVAFDNHKWSVVANYSTLHGKSVLGCYYFIVKQAVPGQVQTPVVSNVAETTLDIQWNKPARAPTSYTVKTVLGGSQSWNVNAPATTLHITGLSASTGYRFTVVAVNAIGNSIVSSPSALVTTSDPIVPASSTGSTEESSSSTAPADVSSSSTAEIDETSTGEVDDSSTAAVDHNSSTAIEFSRASSNSASSVALATAIALCMAGVRLF